MASEVAVSGFGSVTQTALATESPDICSEVFSDFRHEDAFDWLEKAEERSIHAVVTDPPYGL